MTRDLLALNRNEFLFPHPEGVLSALAKAPDLSHYAPLSARTRFEDELSEFLGISPEGLVLGHGAEDLLLKLLLHYRLSRTALILPRLSWGEYSRMGSALNYDVVRTRMTVSVDSASKIVPSLTIDLEDIAQTLEKSQSEATNDETSPAATVIIIPTTNNPTGSRVNARLLKELVSAWPQCVFILDAVYEPLPTAWFREFSEFPNVHVIGSMSKFFGLPGLRLGFCSGSLPPCFDLALGHGQWQLDIARAAMNEAPSYARARALMTNTAHELAQIPLNHIRVFESHAPFVLAKTSVVWTGNNGTQHPLIAQCSQEVGIMPKTFEHEGHLWLRFGLGPQPIGESVREFLILLEGALDLSSRVRVSASPALQETLS